jgi:hypothetical protein
MPTSTHSAVFTFRRDVGPDRDRGTGWPLAASSPADSLFSAVVVVVVEEEMGAAAIASGPMPLSLSALSRDESNPLPAASTPDEEDEEEEDDEDEEDEEDEEEDREETGAMSSLKTLTRICVVCVA